MPLVLRALFFAYTVAVEVIAWCTVVPAVWVRALATGAGPSALQQRLARVPPCAAAETPDPGLVLIHAVSLGEIERRTK